jgi:hypothetical protein
VVAVTRQGDHSQQILDTLSIRGVAGSLVLGHGELVREVRLRKADLVVAELGFCLGAPGRLIAAVPTAKVVFIHNGEPLGECVDAILSGAADLVSMNQLGDLSLSLDATQPAALTDNDGDQSITKSLERQILALSATGMHPRGVADVLEVAPERVMAVHARTLARLEAQDTSGTVRSIYSR